VRGAALELFGAGDEAVFVLAPSPVIISAMLSRRTNAKPYAVSTLKAPFSKSTMVPMIFVPSFRRISSAWAVTASNTMSGSVRRKLMEKVFQIGRCTRKLRHFRRAGLATARLARRNLAF
jgi:hypothetical protein